MNFRETEASIIRDRGEDEEVGYEDAEDAADDFEWYFHARTVNRKSPISCIQDPHRTFQYKTECRLSRLFL